MHNRDPKQFERTAERSEFLVAGSVCTLNEKRLELDAPEFVINNRPHDWYDRRGRGDRWACSGLM